MDTAEYYRYLRDARTELWSFLRGVPEAELDRAVIPGERFRSIKHLLLHIADVEDYWVHEVVRGVEPVLARWPHHRLRPQSERYPLEWIHAYTLAVQDATGEYVDSLDGRELDRVVRPPPPQEERPYRVGSVLWHAFTHEVRHSGQVVVLARQLGHIPPWLDFGRFMRPAPAPV